MISQDPAYFMIGEKEFTNTDIYTLLYDEYSDIIYVGTNNGLYAYKQNKFIPITGIKEQIGNSFFDLSQNQDGDIFCCNMSGQIFQLINDQVSLVFAPPITFGKFHSYEINIKNDLIIAFSDNLVIMSQSGKITSGFSSIDPYVVDSDTIQNLSMYSLLDNQSIVSGNSSNFTYIFLLDSLNKVTKNWKCDLDTPPVSQFIKQRDVFYSVNNQGEFGMYWDSIHQDLAFQQKERLHSINDSTVLGLNSQKGFRYLYLNNDTLTNSSIIYDNLFISCCSKLRNGALIFGTFGEGIRVVSNPQVLKKQYDELFLGIATSPTNNVAICSRSGEIFNRCDNELVVVDKAPHNVDDIYYIPNNKIVTSLGFGQFIYCDSRKGLIGALDVIKMNDQFLFIGTRTGVSLIATDSISSSKLAYVSTVDKGRYTVAETYRNSSLEINNKDSTFYIANGMGLYKTSWYNHKVYNIEFSPTVQAVNDLFFDGNILICSTEEEGIVFLNTEDDQVIFEISESDGLLSNFVLQAEIKEDLLYIITKDGFQVFDLKSNQFIGLGLERGVEPDKITKFALSDDKIWLLEKHSYFSLNLDDIRSEIDQLKISTLYIDSVAVNNKSIDYFNSSVFDYNESAFTFYYDYRELLTKKETHISYTLVGFYTDWKTLETSENKIEFQSLPFGSYTFKIKAEFRNQESETFIYSFEILPPFWQRWWFYLSIGLVAAGLIAIIAVFRIRSLHKKNALEIMKKSVEKNTIDAQLKAIRAQMNPHFIFNSINAIQDLVLQQETIKSYDYLVVFSQMVRTILDFSERDSIPVKEEVDFLNTYLGLEKLRFQDDFEFEITSNLYSNSAKIPSLIVQPFAENAIKHGLLHKEGEKRLKITFSQEEEHILCIVEDNGIGVEEANEINSRQNSNHKSFATDAITKRLQILQIQSKGKAGYVSESIIDYNGEVRGTKVTITLPFN